jgi:hypothetical protein
LYPVIAVGDAIAGNFNNNNNNNNNNNILLTANGLRPGGSG